MVDGVCTDQLKLQLISILSVSTCTSPEEETHKAKREKAQREDKVLQHELTIRERKLIEFYY